MSDIKGFFGDYRFLSNFWMAPITMGGHEYASTEHYYQACKMVSVEDHERVRLAKSAGLSKRLGVALEMRPDWDQVKEFVMSNALHAKFTQHNDLKLALLATGDAYLEETNHWNDTYWGVCNGKGKNRLGHLLMALRNQLKLEGLLSDVQGEDQICP